MGKATEYSIAVACVLSMRGERLADGNGDDLQVIGWRKELFL
jgi:hypothetical protein